jgi:hypothetical protein
LPIRIGRPDPGPDNSRRGAAVDHQGQTQGWTALIWAPDKGHAETVESLLRHGADRTLKDFAGRSAADHVREGGDGALSEQLAASSH